MQKLTMVMEYCERGSLYHVLRNPECLIGWERALDMLEEIVKGIKVLHDHKPAIMHRDLKVCPPNPMLISTSVDIECTSDARLPLPNC